MIEEPLISEETLLERNALLPAVRAEFRAHVVSAAGRAVAVRRRHRQQFLAVAAIVCLACLSIWRIQLVDTAQRGRPAPGGLGGLPGIAPPSPTAIPPIVPIPAPGSTAVETTPARPAAPAGMFQGPILSLMGGGDSRSLEEELQNRQDLIRQVFQSM